MAMKRKEPGDLAAQRRLTARYLGAVMMGVGVGLLLVAWRSGPTHLAIGASLLLVAGLVWPAIMEWALQRFSQAGTRRCLHCGARRRPEEGFCMDCGTRAPAEEDDANRPKEPWEHEW